ncbi:choice-of-anchor P family protein [Actinophytocola gossypii]|uniref:Uncharacterized protein n=1 Tax=Actinophytocola gossypii TaxID=2812003 RepID=A0ABT2JKF2_9PSEU|nr:choice-of-anchor P family protein [Actinophytocola gossypii]MCT2588004.1 hypothetical protein [Actinophytocola gossypii]
MTTRRVFAGLAAVAVVLSTAAPARAAAPVARASLGSADLVLDGEPATIETLAPCAGEVEDATTEGGGIEGFAEFEAGDTTCEVDQGVASASVTGGRFRLAGLAQYGGPELIRIADFTATCESTETGSRSRVRLGELSGVTVPSPIPPNYLVTIPGSEPDAPPIATLTFNEKTLTEPTDGAMTVNLLHVRLFPDGPTEQVTGDIVVGTVTCSPS